MQDPRRNEGPNIIPRAAIPPSHLLARIPSSKIDFPTQRYYAASIFILLQALKLYNAWKDYHSFDPETSDSNLLRWSSYDVLYMLIIWYIRIPWLQITKFKAIFISLALVSLNLFMFVIPVAAVGSALFKNIFGETFTRRIGASRAKKINVNGVINDPSHILGRHTLHILPHGFAELNPLNEFYCLPAGSKGKKDIFIPILMNNTIPYSLTMEHFDFDTKLNTTKGLSRSDFKRAIELNPNNDGLETYYVRIKEPGLYTLRDVKSKDNIEVRTKRKVAYVFTCPTANFETPAVTDLCTGDEEPIGIKVTGVPPFTLGYVRRVGDLEHPSKISHIRPQDVDVLPAEKIHDVGSVEPEFFYPKTNQFYSWAATHQQTIYLNVTLHDPTLYEYQLLNVTDGFGNVVILDQSNAIHFVAHEHPTAKYACSDVDPLKLLINEKYTDIPVELQGSGPWNIKYRHIQDADETVSVLEDSLSSPNSSVRVYHPGIYELLQVNDVFCKGDIITPAICRVIKPPLPTIKVQETPIPSECSGNDFVGMKFFIELTGTPPFNLQYSIYKKSGRTKTIVGSWNETIDRTRYMVSYMPTMSGDYIYEFQGLSDENYKNQPINAYKFSQVVYPQPDASFDESLTALEAVRTCVGETISLDVKLTGARPLTLFWSVSGQMYSEDIQDDKYSLRIPNLEKPGPHVVSLVKIKDANGCLIDLEARDVVVDVRRERPTAGFYTDDQFNGLVEVTQGSTAALPLRLSGKGPWMVGYKNVEDEYAETKMIVTEDPNAVLETKEPGVYEVVSVQDDFCRGNVIPPPYVVRWIEKPQMTIDDPTVLLKQDNTFEKPGVCQGTRTSVDISFQGHSSFYCTYDKYQVGSWKLSPVHLGNEEINSVYPKASVDLETHTSGKYRYIFNKIADQRYTEPLDLLSRPTIEYIVHPLPTVAFAGRNKKERSLCVGDNLSSSGMSPIWLDLTGQAPFVVEIRVKHQTDQHLQTHHINVPTHKYRLELFDVLETSGFYDIELVGVVDHNGCHSVSPVLNPIVTVEAMEVAKISSSDSCAEHCVGDSLDYTLYGVSPFIISYQFNGRNKKITSQSSTLSVLADKPGNVTIVSVGDKRNKCTTYVDNMTSIIHQTPSSFISGGKEVFENIQEGDTAQAVIDLVGTPPFEFKWQRSELIWDKDKKQHHKGNVLETHMVQGVEDKRYYINTAVEGIIEVTYIKDRYCQYPRL
ncbi:hypothetical protein CLU79DRAFT_745847 [Phycomyces nitens]|nr:hypothetical protein CLU79DRAFT_745847 [Phycomyces nitens]